MKTTQFLKAAGGIVCVVFALNVNAQTASSTTSSGSTDTSVGQKVDDSAVTAKVKARTAERNRREVHAYPRQDQGRRGLADGHGAFVKGQDGGRRDREERLGCCIREEPSQNCRQVIADWWHSSIAVSSRRPGLKARVRA